MTIVRSKDIHAVFGAQIVTELTPTVQISNQYALDPDLREDLEVFEATGGSADNLNNMFRCQTGTSVGGYGVCRSVSSLRYRPGEGGMARITAAFTTGIALSLQFAGLFSLTETMAFGYDGADFSVIHEYDGEPEIQEIQITGTAADTVTVTLDGTAASGISITNSDVQTNAREIADALAADSAVNGAWRFKQIDDTVVCVARSVGDKTGTMSVAFAGSATGTITEITAGVAKSNSNVAQGSWDTAPFTGFDPTKLNLYQLEYGYLGAANLRFSIYDPNKGEFVVVHTIKWANNNTTPNFGNPDMKVGWTAASLGSSGTNLTVTGASMMGAVEGKEVIQELSRATFNQKASIGTTFTNVLEIQNRIVYGERFNLGIIRAAQVSVDNDHNKGLVVQIVKNATVSGTPNFQYHDETNSVAVIDTAGTTVSGGEVLAKFVVPAAGAVTVSLAELEALLFPEDTLTVAARTVSGTATNTTATFVWREEK